MQIAITKQIYAHGFVFEKKSVLKQLWHRNNLPSACNSISFVAFSWGQNRFATNLYYECDFIGMKKLLMLERKAYEMSAELCTLNAERWNKKCSQMWFNWISYNFFDQKPYKCWQKSVKIFQVAFGQLFPKFYYHYLVLLTLSFFDSLEENQIFFKINV